MDNKAGRRKARTIGGGLYWNFVTSHNWMAEYPSMYFSYLTGPTDNKDMGKKVKPYMDRKGFFFLMRPLEMMLEQTASEKLATSIAQGNVSDGLKKILEAPLPEFKENYFKSSLTSYVKECIENGKLDFTQYAGDEEINSWLAQQYFHLRPLPVVMNDLKEAVDNHPDQKKMFYEITKETVALFLTGDDPEIDTLSADELNGFADIINEKYKTNKKNSVPQTGLQLYHTEAEAGFFVDPARGRIYDMRPYCDELNALFAPGWEPLKLFAQYLKKGVKAVLKEMAEEKDPQIDFFRNPFVLMYNEAVTNELMRINSYGIKKGASGSETAVTEIKDPKAQGKAVARSRYFMPNLFAAEWQYTSGETVITIPMRDENGNPLKIDEAKRGKHSPMPIFVGATGKLICYLLVLFTRQNSYDREKNKDNGKEYQYNRVVTSNIDAYMLATRKKMTESNKKKVTMILKNILYDLPDISALSNSAKYKLEKMRPFPWVRLENGEFAVEFSSAFARHLIKSTGFTTHLPTQLLALDEKNPNLLPLGYKLSVYRSMENNIRLGKANIISVETCLENCPGIPAIETVRANGGSPYQKIIEPFEKVLDQLKKEGLLEDWEYCLSKGEKLEEAAVLKYNYFIQLYIKFEIKDFPQDQLEARVQEKDEQAAAKKKRMESMIEKNVAKNVANKITDQMAAQKK